MTNDNDDNALYLKFNSVLNMTSDDNAEIDDDEEPDACASCNTLFSENGFGEDGWRLKCDTCHSVCLLCVAHYCWHHWPKPECEYCGKEFEMTEETYTRFRHIVDMLSKWGALEFS
jgi:hypothetical protein